MNAGSDAEEISRIIALVSITREDLFDIGHVLAEATGVLLSSADKTLTVSLRGSYSCGKSIIADTIRDDIWGEASGCIIQDDSTIEQDEYRVRQIRGENLEYDYIDIACCSSFKYDGLNADKYEDREKAFLQHRQHKGVNVIQNKKDDSNADIAVWVEKRAGEIVYYDADGDASRDVCNITPLRRAPRSRLFKVFDAAAAMDRWARYVEISFSSTAFETHPELRAAVATLSKQAEEVRAALQKLRKRKTPDEAIKSRLLAKKYG